MVSALSRKSITDLSRRRSRTFFVVATLALAVASIGLFALPTLMNRSMHAAVVSDRLPDLTVYMRPLPLDRGQLATLAALPNVRDVKPSSLLGGRVWAGDRRAFVEVRGVSGTAPRTGEVLTEAQNANQGLLSMRAGEKVRIIGADGVVRRLLVS